MSKGYSVLNWFEIPVTDLTRATRFYEAVLDRKLKTETFVGEPMAIFPSEAPGTGGALVAGAHRRPSAEGVVLYLDADGKLDACIGRVEAAGGTVLLPKTAIGQQGFFALMRDTEGNTVGLHSRP